MRRTLPGTVPGLIRRCSPVPGGVVVHVAPPWAYVSVSSLAPPEQRRIEGLLLDCDDPTGQDHAMRWIAERMGMAVLSEEIAAGGDVDALIRTVRRLAGGES